MKGPEHNPNEESSERGYLKTERFFIGDVECEFLKVHHTRETLNAHYDEIKESISDADVLISEMASLEDNHDAPEILHFYRGITKIAEELKKILVVPDPEKNIVDALINRFVDGSVALSNFGTLTYATAKFKSATDINSLKNLVRSIREDKPSRFTEKKAKSTRRDFLKFGAAAAVSVPLTLNTSANIGHELGNLPEEDSLLEDFLHTSIDYRDVCIAKEILAKSESFQKIKIIYGAAHFEGVKRYLDDPELLEERAAIYEQTFGRWSPNQVDEFDFRQEELK